MVGYGRLIILGRPKPAIDSQERSRNNTPHDLPEQVDDRASGGSSDHQQYAQVTEIEPCREPDQDHAHPDQHQQDRDADHPFEWFPDHPSHPDASLHVA